MRVKPLPITLSGLVTSRYNGRKSVHPSRFHRDMENML